MDRRFAVNKCWKPCDKALLGWQAFLVLCVITILNPTIMRDKVKSSNLVSKLRKKEMPRVGGDCRETSIEDINPLC